MGHPRNDYSMNNSKVLDAVIHDLVSREQRGLEKYGTTVDRKDLTDQQWLQHAYEEALDFALYIKKLIYEKENQKTGL